TFWLFPILDERTIAMINSQKVPESNHHWIYIVLESVKVILLPGLGIAAFRSFLDANKDRNWIVSEHK
ncbi:MAG: hypothetical protein OEQ28_03235, partial [Acidobacteriota bacterium]|nr:hypothetical protein [Acidobacteriota bacterium]